MTLRWLGLVEICCGCVQDCVRTFLERERERERDLNSEFWCERRVKLGKGGGREYDCYMKLDFCVYKHVCNYQMGSGYLKSNSTPYSYFYLNLSKNFI